MNEILLDGIFMFRANVNVIHASDAACFEFRPSGAFILPAIFIFRLTVTTGKWAAKITFELD